MTKKQLIGAVTAIAMSGAAFGFSAWAADNAPRFPPLTVDKMTPEQKAAAGDLSKYNPSNINAILLRNPGLNAGLQGFAEQVVQARKKTTVPPPIGEMTILFTAKYWGNQANWIAHEADAHKAGTTDAAVNAVAQGKKLPGMTPQEVAAFDFCSELLNKHAVTDATFKAAVSQLGERAVIDMIGEMSVYTFLSLTLNTAEQVPVRAGAEKTPVPFTQATGR